MSKSKLHTLFAAALLLSPPAIAQSTGAAPQSNRQILMAKDLPDLPGKEAMVFTVEYPPGTNNPAHRHFGHIFLHVLEGELNAQVKGGELTVLKPGSTYYEAPADIHVVSRNPSATVKAKAIIFIIHDKGTPLTTPVKE